MALSRERYRSVVITGGKGMLATELIKVLAARACTPVLTDRDECDITDPAQVAKLFEETRPTLLINCAAHTAVDRCEDEPELANAINGIGAGYLARECLRYNTQIVHFSTDFVFNGQSDRPYRPDDIPAPLSAYGFSKLLGEQKIQEIAPPSWIIIRTAWLFGRYGNCFPKVIVDRARAGHPLAVVNDQIGCPTYAVDLAKAVFELVDRGAGGIWHLTNSSPTNWFEFAKAIVTEFGISTEVTPITTAEWVAMRPRQAKRPPYSVMDTSAYTALTSRELRHWHDALRDYRTECEKGS